MSIMTASRACVYAVCLLVHDLVFWCRLPVRSHVSSCTVPAFGPAEEVQNLRRASDAEYGVAQRYFMSLCIGIL